MADSSPEGVLEWISYLQKNKPQSNALVGGLFVMLFSGQHLAWGIFNSNLDPLAWNGSVEWTSSITFWMLWLIISWFIAAAVGAYIGAIFVKIMKKIKIYSICFFLTLLSSTIFIIFSTWTTMLLVGRILAGLSHGIGYITVLIHAGEISVPRLRGLHVALVHAFIFIGVFITSAANTQRIDLGNAGDSLWPNQLLGIIGLVCMLLGLILMFFVHVESPVYYMKKQQSQKAQDMMMTLRKETELMDETRDDFEDLHRMVTEDLTDGGGIFETKNLRSLLAMVILKLAFVSTFNLPVNMILLRSTAASFESDEGDPSALTLSVVRFLTILFSLMFFDSARRLLAAVSSGFLTVIMATLTVSAIIEEVGANQSLMISLAFCLQVFSAIGIGTHVDVYSTECYSFTKKPISIAHSVFVELSVQILLALHHLYPVMSTHWILGIITGVLALTLALVIFEIPDTARLSLVDAKNKFHKTK